MSAQIQPELISTWDDVPATLPDVACAPWCDNNHSTDWHPADRYCWRLEGPGSKVPLTLYPMIKVGDSWRLDCLEVALRRRFDSTITEVLINYEGNNNRDSFEHRLSSGDARALAVALNHLADIADGKG